MNQLGSSLEPELLFTLHGELGYFELFQGQIKLPLMIVGPRGFGKSELFHLLVQQFNDEYIKFTPIASDGISFHQIRDNLIFYSKGKYISIRGLDGLDWDRKTPIEVSFYEGFQIKIAEMRYGILIVGAHGVEQMSRQDYQTIVKEKGHRINFQTQINLIRVKDPEHYLFNLIRDMKEHPAHWKQLVIPNSSRLKKIEGESRLISKLIEFLPTRILELTLPESQNKWGQLRDVFKSLVIKMDRLIISSVEFQLSKMIKQKTSDIISQILYEWKFPDDKQLPDLSLLPEILTISSWLERKIAQHGLIELDLPIDTIESIELGLLGVQTAFIEDLGNVLKERRQPFRLDELKKIITVHSISITELTTNLSHLIEEGGGMPKTLDTYEKTKDSYDTVEKFLQDILEGKI